MKYKIIVCFLFTLITSKREFLSFSTTNCEDAESKDQCLNIDNPQADYQCCYRTSKVNDETDYECSDFIKNIDGVQDFYSSEKFNAYNRELIGYQEYMLKLKIPKQEINFYCKNGKIDYISGGYEFTEDEQKIIADEKFCINKYMRKMADPTFNDGKCEEGLVLDSSKNLGFECGNVLFTIQSDKTISATFCDLFNIYFYSSMLELPTKADFTNTLKKNVNSIVLSNGYKNYKSFTAEYFNERGQKIKYDSKKDEYEIINIDNNNNGYMLTASKYLFLLLLILF